MLPSVVASELEQVAKDAISTFHPTTPGFSGLIERFLADREQLLKGPFVSVCCRSIKARVGIGSRRFRCHSRPIGTRNEPLNAYCQAARKTPWWPQEPDQAKPSVSCCRSLSTAASKSRKGSAVSRQS